MIAESQIDVAADRPPARRLARIAVWIGGVAIAIWVLDLLGIPVREWIDELFDKLGEIPPGAIVAAVVLQSAQTAMAALAWFGILRAMPPGPQVRLPGRAGLLRHGGGLEQLPPGQHRDLGDAGDVHRPLRRRDLPDDALGPRRPEDPVQRLLAGALPLPVPLGGRLLLGQARLPRRTHRADPRDPDRRAGPDRPPRRQPSAVAWRACDRRSPAAAR